MSTQRNIRDLATTQRLAPRPQLALLHDLVAARTEHAARTALEQDGVAISFRELDRWASRIANLLISQGIQSGNVVAIHQERSANLFASLLGVLKAGAAYVVIDPASTIETGDQIVARSDARFILASAQVPALSGRDGVRVVNVDDERDNLEVLPGHVSFAGRRGANPERSASVICRPGTNDVASVKHGDAVSLVRSLVKVYGLAAGQRCAHDPAVAFDVAIEESLAMLASGATVVLDRAPTETPEKLAKFVAQHRITVLSTTPDVVAGVEAALPTLEVLLLGGTMSSADVVAKWAFRVSCLVIKKRQSDRFPSFRIEQDCGVASRPRLICPRAVERQARL